MRSTGSVELAVRGRALDGAGWRQGVARLPALPPSAGEGAVGDEPSVALDLGDAYVLAKPPGWVVDSGQPGDNDDDPSLRPERSIVAFLRARSGGWAPIVHDRVHRHGILHRLDANSSGLVLGAFSFSRYYALHALLDAQQVDREYVVLLHGQVPPEITLVNARVHRGPSPGDKSTVAPEGKPAMTRLKVIAHLERHTDDGTRRLYSLVVIQLLTGRTHQIRCHMKHLGHPVVCDAKYTSGATFMEDMRWCRRNFLHRYRLAFEAKEVLQPLPPDLSDALRRLAPLDTASGDAARLWLTGAAGLQPYCSQERLPDAHGVLAPEAAWPPHVQSKVDGDSDDLVWRLSTLCP